MTTTSGFNKDSITATLVYKLLPVAVCLILAASLFLLWNEQNHYLSSTLCIVLMASVIIVTLILIIGVMAYYAYGEEEKLRYNEKLSRLLVENRKDYAIFMLDKEGRVTSWNAGAERLTGYESADVMGKDFDYFFSDDDRRAGKPKELLRLAAGLKQLEYEGWRMHKQGGRFWATITLATVYDDQHQLIGFTELIRNSTRQKEADEKLKTLLAELERSNQELERFAYIASHDLQEPLRMVASYTQLLEKKYRDQLDKEALEYIAFATDGVLRMQQLITDLLSYSRVATKERMTTEVDLQSVLNKVLQNLRVAIEEAKAEIVSVPLPTVTADETQMVQLFQNLLSNALKFHTDKPIRIQIDVRRVEDEWVLSFQDNGIGIAPEFHEKIFLIFQRLHSRNEYEGTGVGLAVCKKIVERHGGKMWVESTLGEGAKFCFTLPT